MGDVYGYTRRNNETADIDDCEIVFDNNNNSKMGDVYGYARRNNETAIIDYCEIV